MGQAIAGGGGMDKTRCKETTLADHIVLHTVRVVEIEKPVEIPKMVVKEIEVEQTKYITKEEDTIRYKVSEKPTVKYNVEEQVTTKYNVNTEETTKYVCKEQVIEKPVIKEVEYEKPIITERNVEVINVKDLDNIKALSSIVKDLALEIEQLKKKLNELKEFKLVEELVRVPKIEWMPTQVERIVWKDVIRER